MMRPSEQFAASAYVPYNNNNTAGLSKSAPCSPNKVPANSNGPAAARVDPFHIVHKVPVGDTPYVKAKHAQLVDRDPDRAIALFWAAINSGDRVDSALKDMAIVMKQQNRPEEAIEAVKSLRMRCSDQAQESLDNVLLDLYKRCGRLDDQIDLLKHKLHLIHQGMAFNGKRTKTARSQGKKFQVSVEQEATRLLGNLGWTYMQQSKYAAAEVVYRKALSIESDNNKVCNLGICLMKQGRLEEAKSMLQSVTPVLCNDGRWASDSHMKSYERAQEMLEELETSMSAKEYLDAIEKQLNQSSTCPIYSASDIYHQESASSLWQPQPALPRQPRRISSRQSLELHLESQSNIDPAMKGAFLATSGFGPLQDDCSDNSCSDSSQDSQLTDMEEMLEWRNADSAPVWMRPASLPPLHSAPGKQSWSMTVVAPKVEDEKVVMSTWNMMGFAYNPSDLDLSPCPNLTDLTDQFDSRDDHDATLNFGEHERLSSMETLLASEVEMRHQRRLRVFQEMTLPTALQV